MSIIYRYKIFFLPTFLSEHAENAVKSFSAQGVGQGHRKLRDQAGTESPPASDHPAEFRVDPHASYDRRQSGCRLDQGSIPTRRYH